MNTPLVGSAAHASGSASFSPSPRGTDLETRQALTLAHSPVNERASCQAMVATAGRTAQQGRTSRVPKKPPGPEGDRQANKRTGRDREPGQAGRGQPAGARAQVPALTLTALVPPCSPCERGQSATQPTCAQFLPQAQSWSGLLALSAVSSRCGQTVWQALHSILRACSAGRLAVGTCYLCSLSGTMDSRHP